MPRARPDCGNPLLRNWMAEWMEEAKNMQAKSYYTFKKAHDSLSACPMPFAHPSEAQQLNGIGPKLAIRLEKKMMDYCEENGLPVPERRKKGKRRLDSGIDNSRDLEGPSTNKRARPPPRPYIPRFRTGSYAILLTLLDFKDDGQVAATKTEIIRHGQSYCDASMDLAEPGSNYTAWSGIKILKEKGYVWQNGSPPRFSLTETGEAMAEQLRTASNDDAPSSSRNANGRRQAGTSSSAMSSQYTENDNSQSNSNEPPEIDLSLYVLDPDAYRRERATSTTSTRAPASAPTTPDVDLSLYVLDPDAYRRERPTSATTSTSTSTSTTVRPRAPAPAPTTPDVDLSLYVLDPDAYRRERTISSPSPSSSPSSNVDLSLYVLDPDAYRKERSTSASTQNRERSTPTTTRRPQYSPHYNLDDDDDDEPAIDLSNYVSDHNSYQQDRSTPAGRNTKIHGSQSPRSTISTTPSLHIPSKKRANHSDDVEIITLLSPTPSPPNSPVRPTSSMNSSQTQGSSTNLFQYTYLDTSGDSVRHMSQAAVDIDENRGYLMYKIRYSSNQKQHSKTRRLVGVNHSTCTGYILETDADVVCPGLPARPLLPLHHDEHQKERADDFWPDLSQSSQPASTSTSTHNSQNTRMDLTEQPRQVTGVERRDWPEPARTTTTTTTTTSLRATARTAEATLDIPSIITIAKQEGRLWRPEDYSIMMILDNREVKMKTNREYIQDTLMEKGVAVEKRALDVGDVLWVAKHVETDEEMYLDVILERKRMDDLVSSVKDGRFHEQKYRLKQSGSRKVFYVVEEYNKEIALKFGAQAIQTAMSCVQAVDQFYLKRTGSLDETIDYLVRLTKMIEKLYMGITLQEIPIQLINRSNYLALKKGLSNDESTQQQASPHHVIPYTIFNQLNSKSGSSTLQDLYTKMLMAIRGVNAEKACALTRTYPTPYRLLKAMEETVHGGGDGDGGGGKNLAVRATKEGISRRRWGSGISERLWEVWGKQHQ
ncbi:unnamed protein product [Absidia cylindrospora]